MRWTRGVDTDRFRPAEPGAPVPAELAGLPRPLFLYVGRLAVEKNVAAFLSLDLPGTKVVVGDGPDRGRLQALASGATFLGTRTGAALAAVYAACDVFVFPSLTDTFGIVLLEALASGLPVAAYPVPGPNDVVGGTRVGILDRDLRAAALAALGLSRAEVPRRGPALRLGRERAAVLRQHRPGPWRRPGPRRRPRRRLTGDGPPGAGCAGWTACRPPGRRRPP